MNTAINVDLTGNDIDDLGFYLAQIADLTKKAERIKKELKESGVDSLEGRLFRAVSITQERTTYDTDVLKAAVSDAILDLAKRESLCQMVKVTSR